MLELRRRLIVLIQSGYSVPFVLLILCILSYGILIPWLGFYWDDWAFVWISQKLGPEALTRYFSTNRPVWGLFYQATTQLLGSVPWHWQVFGLFWRWVSGVALWGVLRLLWPRRSRAASWAAMLFVVYPGFDQQSISITYGHFFIVLSAFLFSIAAMLAAVRRLGSARLWLALALFFSLVNLLSMEYFFLLDFLRPLLLWVVVRETTAGFWPQFKRVLRYYTPYLSIFAGAVIWRTMIFKYQTNNYQFGLMEQFRLDWFGTLVHFLTTVAVDMWKTGVIAWGQIFRLPNSAQFGVRTTQLYALLVFVSAAFVVMYLVLQSREKNGGLKFEPWALQACGLGLAGLLLAGFPFWATQLPVGLTYPNSRFALPFMLGAVLILTGILGLLPLKEWMRILLLGILLGFAAGYQYQAANAFRRDWNIQKTLFWQMSWRIPQLEPGTALLANDLPTAYTSDNSLSSPLNWIYAPDNHSERMSYILYYVSLRKETGLRGLRPDTPIEQNYLAARFYGSTADLVAIYYDPPACLRVLDPETDAVNRMIPVEMRQAASLANLNRIRPADSQTPYQPPEHIYGGQPPSGWCYYFEKADLARQFGEWQEVVRLGEEAFNLGDYPNDPLERLPFIEGYAHIGHWEQALALTKETAAITPLTKEPLCALWQRIGRSVLESSEKNKAISQIVLDYACEIQN